MFQVHMVHMVIHQEQKHIFGTGIEFELATCNFEFTQIE